MYIPRIVITSGEPAGIGPDACVALAQNPWKADIVVAADEGLLAGMCRITSSKNHCETITASTPEEQLEESAEEYDRLIIDRENQLGVALAYMLQSEAARERDEVARGERQSDGAYLIKQEYVAMLLNKKYDGETGWDENGPYGAWEETIIQLGGSMLDAASNPNKAGKR